MSGVCMSYWYIHIIKFKPIIDSRPTVETQRYFLGGITGEEIHAGVLPKRKIKRYVMQELGRHPEEDIVEIAEAIAGNRKFDAWTQKEIVDLLKDIRIGRDPK